MAIKISFDFLKKNKRDIYFVLVGLVLLFCLIYLFIDGVSFIVLNVEGALDLESSSYVPVMFNIGGLKSLGIYQEQPTTTPNAGSASDQSPASASPITAP